MTFSSLNRPEIIHKLKSKTFDLLIIGGGITGAGIALDAASRGLSVALVEKNDFASGTSSRSTKLIHGGLRYLKQLEFGLVKEVGSERAVVHKLAPHLVIPEKMLLPLVDGKSMSYWLTSIGLKIYDWLAGVKKEDRRIMLSRQQTLRAEPLLNKSGIKGGALYAEYRTDDARLTIEIMKTAVRHGAIAINYVKCIGFEYDTNGLIVGIKACDELTGKEFSIRSKTVINAAGPWVDEVRQMDHSISGKHVQLTKGVHIVVDRKHLPVKQAIYFEVADGRMIFAIPRFNKTYIGTTDTNYSETKDQVYATVDDVDYLLKAVNENFENVNLTQQHVESSWAGLRPLISEEGKTGSALSRKDEIFEWTSGLISIAGGKLTGYRKMAERVVDLVVEKYFNDKELKPCSTEHIPLLGNAFKDYKDVIRYRDELKIRLMPSGLDDWADYLLSNYGSQTEIILQEAQYKHLITTEDLLLAELNFCIQHEMVVTPEDFFIRRTGMLYFDVSRMEKMLPVVLDFLAEKFHWPKSEIKNKGNKIRETISKTTVFRDLHGLGV